MTSIRVFLSSLACAGALAIAIPISASAAVVNHPGALPVLLGIDGVRKDLKLTSLQVVVQDSIRNEYRAEAQQIYAATRFNDPVSCAASEKAFKNLQAKYNRRVLSTLNKGQKVRLGQIEVQVLGGFLLLRESFQQRLSVKAAQKAKIAKIETKNRKYLQKLNRLTVQKKITPLKRVVALHNLRKNSSEALLKTLTPEQRQKLISWGGEPFQS